MPAVETRPIAKEADFLELSIILPRWQVYALDDLARSRGQNVGQMMRRLIGNLLEEVSAQVQP
jgi:hypothetical protein